MTKPRIALHTKKPPNLTRLVVMVYGRTIITPFGSPSNCTFPALLRQNRIIYFLGNANSLELLVSMISSGCFLVVFWRMGFSIFLFAFF